MRRLKKVGFSPYAMACCACSELKKFIHAPGAGKELKSRLTVSFLPENEPKRAIGGISAFQQVEEFRQLASLAASVQPVAVVEGEPGTTAPEMDEAGQLASWLIHQANSAGV